jgi:hypothetical protein
MHDATATLVAPAARQGGTAERPSSEVRLARGLDAPSGEFRLARGPNAPSGGDRLTRGLNPTPRARSASLEGSTPPRRGPSRSRAPAHTLPALLPPCTGILCSDIAGCTPRPGAVPPTPWGRPSLPLCSIVRRGRCQLRDIVPPTPERLTRRALEGGPVAPSNVFSVITQGHAVTSGRRDRSPPSLSALCGHPRHCRTTPAL